jgi:hypothetical protein
MKKMGLFLVVLAVMITFMGCTFHHTKDIIEKLQPTELYESYEVTPADLKARSKCPLSPTINIVNMEMRDKDYSIFNPPTGKSTINPRELTIGFVEYLKYGFEKSQITVDSKSSRIIHISFMDAKTLRGVWTIGGNIKMKVSIPETKYSHIYEAKDWSPTTLSKAMAYAIHDVTRKIIDDPVIQDYILCNTEASYSNKIFIIAGTYGENCGVPYGNKTEHFAKMCSGLLRCEYTIDEKIIGDPYVGCKKNYIADWRCGSDNVSHRINMQPEAGNQKKITLSCP